MKKILLLLALFIFVAKGYSQQNIYADPLRIWGKTGIGNMPSLSFIPTVGLHLMGNNSKYAGGILQYANASDSAGMLSFYRSRGTILAPTISIDGDTIYNIAWNYYTGSAWRKTAYMGSRYVTTLVNPTGTFYIYTRSSGGLLNRFFIDGSGNTQVLNGYLGVGGSPSFGLHLMGESLTSSTQGIQLSSNDTRPPRLGLAKTRGTIAALLPVNSGDTLGKLSYYGTTSTTLASLWSGVELISIAKENFSSANHGAEFLVRTTDTVTDLLATRFKITELGNTEIQNGHFYLVHSPNAGAVSDSVLVRVTATGEVKYVAQGSIFDSTAFLAACHPLLRYSQWDACSPATINADSIYGTVANGLRFKASATDTALIQLDNTGVHIRNGWINPTYQLLNINNAGDFSKTIQLNQIENTNGSTLSYVYNYSMAAGTIDQSFTTGLGNYTQELFTDSTSISHKVMSNPLVLSNVNVQELSKTTSTITGVLNTTSVTQDTLNLTINADSIYGTVANGLRFKASRTDSALIKLDGNGVHISTDNDNYGNQSMELYSGGGLGSNYSTIVNKDYIGSYTITEDLFLGNTFARLQSLGITHNSTFRLDTGVITSTATGVLNNTSVTQDTNRFTYKSYTPVDTTIFGKYLNGEVGLYTSDGFGMVNMRNERLALNGLTIDGMSGKTYPYIAYMDSVQKMYSFIYINVSGIHNEVNGIIGNLRTVQDSAKFTSTATGVLNTTTVTQDTVRHYMKTSDSNAPIVGNYYSEFENRKDSLFYKLKYHYAGGGMATIIQDSSFTLRMDRSGFGLNNYSYYMLDDGINPPTINEYNDSIIQVLRYPRGSTTTLYSTDGSNTSTIKLAPITTTFDTDTILGTAAKGLKFKTDSSLIRMDYLGIGLYTDNSLGVNGSPYMNLQSGYGFGNRIATIGMLELTGTTSTGFAQNAFSMQSGILSLQTSGNLNNAQIQLDTAKITSTATGVVNTTTVTQDTVQWDVKHLSSSGDFERLNIGSAGDISFGVYDAGDSQFNYEQISYANGFGYYGYKGNFVANLTDASSLINLVGGYLDINTNYAVIKGELNKSYFTRRYQLHNGGSTGIWGVTLLDSANNDVQTAGCQLYIKDARLNPLIVQNTTYGNHLNLVMAFGVKNATISAGTRNAVMLADSGRVVGKPFTLYTHSIDADSAYLSHIVGSSPLTIHSDTSITSTATGVVNSTTVTQDTAKYKIQGNSSDIFLVKFNKQIHDNANDTLFSLVIGADSSFTANVNFGYRNDDGTDRQSRSGIYNIACSIKAGSEAGYQFTSSVAVQHLTGGSTLAETLSLDYVQATSTLYVIVKYNSSLTPTSNKINYTITDCTGVKTVITPYDNIY